MQSQVDEAVRTTENSGHVLTTTKQMNNHISNFRNKAWIKTNLTIHGLRSSKAVIAMLSDPSSVGKINEKLGWGRSSRMGEQYGRWHSMVGVTESYKPNLEEESFDWNLMCPEEVVDQL